MELVEISMLMLSLSAGACINISHLHPKVSRFSCTDRFLPFANIVSSVLRDFPLDVDPDLRNSSRSPSELEYSVFHSDLSFMLQCANFGARLPCFRVLTPVDPVSMHY